MKLVRPYIPLDVRIEVIARQLQLRGRLYDVLSVEVIPTANARLTFMLHRMFGQQKVHLDHDPPLCLREIVDAENGIYIPAANDPRYLIYRTEEQHRIKTFVRGDGAQYSDAALRRRDIRRRLRNLEGRPSRWPPRGSRPLRGRSRW